MSFLPVAGGTFTVAQVIASKGSVVPWATMAGFISGCAHALRWIAFFMYFRHFGLHFIRHDIVAGVSLAGDLCHWLHSFNCSWLLYVSFADCCCPNSSIRTYGNDLGSCQGNWQAFLVITLRCVLPNTKVNFRVSVNARRGVAPWTYWVEVWGGV